MARRTGRKLLQYDRKLGARFVAGADEAGRGPLAGPLLVAGVLLDYARLHDHAVRPLACLNDSKQCSEAEREVLFRAREQGRKTELSLTQTGFPSESSRQAHRARWEDCLATVARLVE